MAKRLSVEESKQKVIDAINLLKDAENANIEKYMDRYASLRALEGEAREEAYKDIAFAIFGDYRETEAPDQAEDEEPEEILQAEEEKPLEVEPHLETVEELQTVEVEPQEEALPLQARGKQENVAFSVLLPPRTEIVPLGYSETVPLAYPETATKSILERLLAIWDGMTATVETVWEMYLAPVAMVLLSLLGTSWMVAKAVASLLWMGGKMAYRGAKMALPVIGASIVRAWGVMVVVALLGAKLAIYGAHAGSKVVSFGTHVGTRAFSLGATMGAMALSFGADLAAKTARTIREGWTLREDLINEWREEVA